MRSTPIKQSVFFIAIFLVLALLFRGLFNNKNTELPSALIGEPIPHFELQNLLNPKVRFDEKVFLGKVSLLNVWATWCYACKLEHGMLLQINQKYHVPLYGISYKDTSFDITRWLQKYGNPYLMLGNDIKGDVGIDLGIFGTPETFIINKKGKIVYRHIGILTEETWENVLYPLIKKLETAV